MTALGRLTAAPATAGRRNCSLPTHSITDPVTLPAAATAPTAVKLDDAAVGRRRPANVAVTFKTSAPANAVTWTDPVDVDVQHQLRPLTAPPGPADRARRATARR